VRRWYRTPRWRALRAEVLAEQPTCVACRAAPSRHVDHRVPHRGDPVLFWDRANLQGLCESCHGRKTGHGN
jgi:5-methylcytosine-specific restriction enzyme A